ncbi:DUF1707 domain-containing protein [Blastococcus brunescens]|uniref:DUF1707 domain-containing protein n=1 Tax=Blastococcus brunescens TaxID=1564165 RepID=A0ABZ1AYF9_9ACTN|nr:DUF1707 domain-containing protein [Blastococcus sp. BMG 8361]WRL62134.1 DUF1707 domain-containing protein [Blastococcus sp. BMG 8361]
MTTARHLRVSDAERQAAAARIGAAWAEGRLDDAEYDRRLAQAFAAVTYGDLDQLFADLPGPRPVQPRRSSGRLLPPTAPCPASGRPRGAGSRRARSGRCARPGCRCCCSSSRSASGDTCTSSRPTTR